MRTNPYSHTRKSGGNLTSRVKTVTVAKGGPALY